MLNPQPLNPTLWRTCRVLANPVRLGILTDLLQKGPSTVTRITHVCALREPRASQHLRSLQSRGLLSATRRSRWVYYAAEPDPLVQHAAAFLQALKDATQQKERKESQIRALTALTHPRRILILRALSGHCMNSRELGAACQISRPALYRHLEKLERRNLVARLDDDTYQLTPPSHGLALALLRLALSSAA